MNDKILEKARHDLDTHALKCDNAHYAFRYIMLLRNRVEILEETLAVAKDTIEILMVDWSRRGGGLNGI